MLLWSAMKVCILALLNSEVYIQIHASYLQCALVNLYVEMGSVFLTVSPVMGMWTVAMEVMRIHLHVVKSFVSLNYAPW